MTPEETKRYIEHHLSELGWNVHIGKAAYDRIVRFTDGAEDTAEVVCRKLHALGTLQDTREITDDVVGMAMTDLVSGAGRTARGDGRESAVQLDLASIEQLTAVLETKVANGEAESELAVTSAVRRDNARPPLRNTTPAAALPKILVADASPAACAAYVKALGRDFATVQAADGEEAWKTLLEQSDIELVITGLKLPRLDGHELVTRIRAAVSPPHLVGIPIIVAADREEADAKLRVLMAGANDFVLNDLDPGELRSRVMARHRLHKSAPRAPAMAPRQLDVPPRRVGADGRAQRSPPRPSSAKRPTREPTIAKQEQVPTLIAERRFPHITGKPAATGDSRRASLITQIYRVSSTTTITLSATVLLALAILAIVYIGRNAVEPKVTTSDAGMVAGVAEVAPRAESGAAGVAEAPDEPSLDARSGQVAGPAPPADQPATATPARRHALVAPDANSISKARPERSPAISQPPGGASRAEGVAKPPEVTPQLDQRPSAPVPEAAPVPPAAAPSEATRSSPAPAAAAPPREEVASAAPPPAPAVSRISREELTAFLRRFASVYEAGDLDQFLGLFAENARTNDRTGRRGIREDYDALFRATDLRSMKLGEISWEVEANQAYGWGDFDVTVRRAVDQESYVYTGSLTFVLEKVDGRLRITRLYHGQRRADTG